MKNRGSKQRLYAGLLGFGACILIYRTTRMMVEGAMVFLMLWVTVLLVMEFSIDAGCLFTTIKWWIKDDESYSSTPLRLGAAAAILHAFRVLIFVLGRTTPFLNFDVRPEH